MSGPHLAAARTPVHGTSLRSYRIHPEEDHDGEQGEERG